MKNRVIICFILLLAGYTAAAGDVAEFKDLGFSADGKAYFFAQYGVQDGDYRPYAEIYSIDTIKNTYIRSGLFSSMRKASEKGKNGQTEFEELFQKNAPFFSPYKPVPADIERTIYLRGLNHKKPGEEIRFKDFENSTAENQIYYHIQLVQHVEGSGASALSSFFIVIEKKDEKGTLIARKVAGTPDYKRKGVLGYTIEKIITDPSCSYLAIIVEKQVADVKGNSVRYMAECCPAIK